MKKLITLLTLVLLALSLSGCTTTRFKPPGPAAVEEYGPANQGAYLLGTATYMTSGADFIVKDRRKQMMKKMYEECDGHYEIIREYNSSSNPTTHISHNQTMNTSTAYTASYEYKTMVFDCL